jgi:hypothetical protein
MFMASARTVGRCTPIFMACIRAPSFAIHICTSAARTGDCIGTPNGKQESKMSKKAGALSAGLTIMVLAGAAMVSLGTSPAQAVVYCKTVGIPKGCVVRPAAAVVVAPRAPVAAVAVATPGVGAPGVGVRVGTPMNRGGPVNRVGVR